jgi:hypothetical protein
MDNKYYIPTLEEFHVGFRYEFNTKVLRPGTDGWEGMSLEVNELTNIEFHIERGEIRVKYLDQADLVELGWKGVQQDVYERVVYRGDKNYCWQILLNHPPEVYIRSYLMDSSAEWMPSMQFRLVIDVKNFDEMKKLMQMFQIA